MQQFSRIQPRLSAALVEGVTNCEHIGFSDGVNASVGCCGLRGCIPQPLPRVNGFRTGPIRLSTFIREVLDFGMCR